MNQRKGDSIVALQAFRQVPPGARRSASRNRICLVDANTWAAETLQEILRAFGYDVDTFHDPDSALTAMEAIDFDVVLIAQLPQPKREFILGIRTLPRESMRSAPIIVFSQVNSETLQEKMREYGAACLLPATAAPERIHDTICELLSAESSLETSADGETSARTRIGMLVTSARDAALQTPFMNARRPLDLFFSAGEALLAIARTPYQAFVVVEHNTRNDSGGVQLVSIVRQMVDPGGTLLPIVVVSTAADADARFSGLGANRVLSLPIAESLVDCVDDVITQVSIHDAFTSYLQTTSMESLPEQAAANAPHSGPAVSESAAVEMTPQRQSAPAADTSKPSAHAGDGLPKKERRAEDGPPPPPPPVLKNKKAKQLMAENSELFTRLFPAAKQFVV